MRPAQNPSQTPALYLLVPIPLQVPKPEETLGAGHWQLPTPGQWKKQVEPGAQGTVGRYHGKGGGCQPSPELAREQRRCCHLWKSVSHRLYLNGALLPTGAKPNPRPLTFTLQRDLSMSCWLCDLGLNVSATCLSSLSSESFSVNPEWIPSLGSLSRSPEGLMVAFSICSLQYCFVFLNRPGNSWDGISSGSSCLAQCLAQTHLLI